MKTIKIDNDHVIGIIYDFDKKPYATFTCSVKGHGYSCEQPFNFCPSCGRQLPLSLCLKITSLFDKLKHKIK